MCLGITRVYPDIVIKEANCDEDHIHLLMRLPPKMAISWVVNVLKSNTARSEVPVFEETVSKEG